MHSYCSYLLCTQQALESYVYIWRVLSTNSHMITIVTQLSGSGTVQTVIHLASSSSEHRQDRLGLT